MRKVIYLYLLISLVLVAYSSCEDNEEIRVNGISQVVKVPDDIQSYNSVTREIVFREEVAIGHSGVGGDRIEIQVAGHGSFAVNSIASISSMICDEPVLLEDNQRYYLYDGYPLVEVLQNKEKHQEDRDNQMKQIEKAWEGFLNVLEQAGKLR